MNFFNTIFDWLADLSGQLPEIGIESFYIVVAVATAALAVIIGFTFFGSRAYKMKRACRRILSRLEDEDVINDDNVARFTSECFGEKTPASMRETWLSYLGVRFGYPSETVSEADVFDKEVKRPDSVRANVFIAVALILTALFAFWGLGAMGTAEVGVVLCLGLLIGAVGYLVLWIAARRQYAAARKAFEEMQDELDAKVNLQVERDYAPDASPLLQIAAIMDGIIAKNTSKPAPTEEEVAAAVAAKQAERETAEDQAAGTEGQSASADDETQTSVTEAEKTPIELAVDEAESVSEGDGAERISDKEENEGRDGDVSEEINDEDEENMFGRKKKKLQQAELTARGYDDLVVDGELLPDDDGQGAEEATLVAAPAQPQQQTMLRGSQPESLEGLNIAARPTADSSVTVSLEPEVIYVEENLDEGDEDIKPPRLAKLPHLVDYVLTMKLSRSMKMRVAMLMLQAYTVFKNSPENKAIVVQCLTKVMKSLMADHAAAQAARAAAQAQAEAAQADEAQAAADTAENQD